MSVDPVSLAIEAALFAANLALSASQTFEGPRLDNLRVATADFGAQLNNVKGTRRISGVSCIYAEPLREVKSTNKTKGGKYNEYKYYGTWAVVVCEHPSDGVTRIWFDKQLVYDATGAGPITPLGGGGGLFGDIAGAAATTFARSAKGSGDYLRIYTGSEDQEPDPRMSATLDAEFGAGSTPAFRGVTYVMFEDIPLEKFGNRFPLVEVEVVTASTAHYPYTTIDSPVDQPKRLWGATFSPDGTRFMWSDNQDYAIVDLAARQVMITGTFPSTVASPRAVFGISQAGDIYTTNSGPAAPGDLKIFNPDGFALRRTIPLTWRSDFCQVLSDADGNEYCLVTGLGGFTSGLQYFAVNGLPVITAIDNGWAVTQYLNDTDGNIWAVGRDYGTNVLHFYCVQGARGGESHTVVSASSSTGDGPNAVHNGNGAFVVGHGGDLFLVDDQTFTVGASVAVSFDGYNRSKQFINCRPGAASIWLNFAELSLTTLATLRTVDPNDWKSENADGVIYDSFNHALICAPSSDFLVTWRYLDRIGGAGVVLADIVADVATRSGLASDEFDASALDQTITGYSWTQGNGKAIVSPLLEVYDSFARPHDFILQFLKRGSGSAGTIATGEMGAGGDTRYTVTATLDSDLPRRINFTFADPAMDQQPNSVPAQRQGGTVDSAREQSLDATTLVIDVDFARHSAERYLRRQWFEAEAYEAPLSRRWTKLEPGDVYTLTLDDAARTAQLQSVEFGANGVLTTNWNRDAPAIHVLNSLSGAPADGYDPATLPVVGYTKGFVLDIPLVTDADDGLIVYLAAAPYSDTTWPGAVFYEGTDGSTFPTLFDVVASDKVATWGVTDGVLPDAATEVWDRGSSVTVEIHRGVLTSATEAAVENGANLALIGQEIVGFRDAVLVSDGVYTLTGFLRGRRGTEWATGTHADAESFVLLSGLTRHAMGASDVGADAFYKPVTAGGLETAGFSQELTYYGASLRPYAPAHVEVTDDSGDKVVTWVRRSRIGGAWRDFADTPLGEGSEAYAAAILDAGGATIRTITGLTSPTLTYTAAQQSADGGLGVSVAVGQVSTTVGVGYLTTVPL